MCEHGRQRYYCKECGGPGICEHGRQRSTCKECGGPGICEHGRQRSRCKECKECKVPSSQGAAGTSGGEYEEVPLAGGGYKRRRAGAKQWRWYCEHGRERYYCKECGGPGLCEHGRQRYHCKECGGSGICKHGRRRYDFKECP